jgi:hypothetical protein
MRKLHHPSVDYQPPLFEGRGGAQIGKSYWWSHWATPPLVKIAVFPDYISIEIPGKTYRFSRDNVTKIEVYKVLGIAGGLRMQHSQPGCGPYVVFGVSPKEKNEALLGILQANAYPILRENSS